MKLKKRIKFRITKVDFNIINFQLIFSDVIIFKAHFSYLSSDDPFTGLRHFLETIITNEDASFFHEYHGKNDMLYVFWLKFRKVEPEDSRKIWLKGNELRLIKGLNAEITIKKIDRYEFVKAVYRGFLSHRTLIVKKTFVEDPSDDFNIGNLKSEKIEYFLKSFERNTSKNKSR